MNLLRFGHSLRLRFLSTAFPTMSSSSSSASLVTFDSPDKASIKESHLTEFHASYTSNPRNILATNAVCTTDVLNILLNRERVVWNQASAFSTRMKYKEAKATNQKSSGRCWLFAATNVCYSFHLVAYAQVIRLRLMEKHKIEEFEFSQSFLFFWDKFEKSNYFLENIIATAGSHSVDSRLVSYLLKDPICDGGQYDMIVNLVKKHGLVPKEAYPETAHSGSSRRMNWLITFKLREYAQELRDLVANQSVEKARERKVEMMRDIYRILCIFLGPPPTKFDWSFYDKDKKYQEYKDLTPLTFVKEHVPFEIGDMVSLIHDPRNEYGKLYTVNCLGNVADGSGVRYINVSIEDLKKYAAEQLSKGEPVWFGCDVGKFFHRDLHVMDTKLFDYEVTFGVDFTQNKADRLRYGQSLMTHAMVFTAFDGTKDDVKRWRVENSWGDKNNKGYATMSDEWFSEFMYQVVVDRDVLPAEVLEVLKQEPVVLPAWDPMGSLA